MSHDTKPDNGQLFDDPSPAPTAYVGVLFTVLVVITVVALVAYFERVEAREDFAKKVAPTNEELVEHLSEQQSRISEYRWVDEEAGQIAVPIDRAMELVASEWAANER